MNQKGKKSCFCSICNDPSLNTHISGEELNHMLCMICCCSSTVSVTLLFQLYLFISYLLLLQNTCGYYRMAAIIEHVIIYRQANCRNGRLICIHVFFRRSCKIEFCHLGAKKTRWIAQWLQAQKCLAKCFTVSCLQSQCQSFSISSSAIQPHYSQ